MARQREEFDYKGKHYESFNQCIRLSGDSAKKIKEGRTNVKKVRMENNIVIPPSKRGYKKESTSEAKKRTENRRRVDDLLEQKRADTSHDWMEDFA